MFNLTAISSVLVIVIIILIAIFIFLLSYKVSLISEEQKENRKVLKELEEDRRIAEYNYDNVGLDMKIGSYIETGMFGTQFKMYILYDLLSGNNDFVINGVDCRRLYKNKDINQLIQFAEGYKTALLVNKGLSKRKPKSE